MVQKLIQKFLVKMVEQDQQQMGMKYFRVMEHILKLNIQPPIYWVLD